MKFFVLWQGGIQRWILLDVAPCDCLVKGAAEQGVDLLDDLRRNGFPDAFMPLQNNSGLVAETVII